MLFTDLLACFRFYSTYEELKLTTLLIEELDCLRFYSTYEELKQENR